MKTTLTFFTFLFVLNSFSQTINEPAIDRLDLSPVQVQEAPVIAVGEIEENLVFPYAVLDKTPAFPNCKYTNETENKACFYEKLKAHIKKHLKYPKEAKENKVESKTIVLFEINKEGNIINLKTRTRSTNKEFNSVFDEEAIRIISKLPKLIPGQQKGKTVAVSYAIPIIFSLTDK
jgi:TonB family protein